MPTYILLSNLTAQGVQTLKSNPARLREVNSDVEELGAKVVHQWATLGPFDFVNVVEAPDAATIARVSVALGARGSAKLQTLTALTIDDFLGTGGAVANLLAVLVFVVASWGVALSRGIARPHEEDLPDELRTNKH